MQCDDDLNIHYGFILKSKEIYKIKTEPDSFFQFFW